jgi:hypothetical protein
MLEPTCIFWADLTPFSLEALHLIAEMLRLEPEDRRAVAELLRHPWWLWTAAVLPFSLMPLYINHNRSNPTLNKRNRPKIFLF